MSSRNRKIGIGGTKLSYVLYSKDDCQPCKFTKNALQAQGIPFEERNINSNPTHADKVKELGYSTVPLLVSDGEIISAGFEPQILTKL